MVAHDGDDLAKGMRKKKRLRDRSGKGRKERESKNEGPIWWLLGMVTIGVEVAACGGAMKGQ